MNTILLVLLAAWAGWRGRGAREAGRVRSWTLLGYRLTLCGTSDFLDIEPAARGEDGLSETLAHLEDATETSVVPDGQSSPAQRAAEQYAAWLKMRRALPLSPADELKIAAVFDAAGIRGGELRQ